MPRFAHFFFLRVLFCWCPLFYWCPKAPLRALFSRGSVAVLALLLSAAGGVRFGLDRLLRDDVHDQAHDLAVVQPLDVDQHPAAVLEPTATPALLLSRVTTAALEPLALTARVVPCAGLLLGSARGPRAP